MEKNRNDIPYENCLNCGTKLAGKFCHKCGQQATSKTPKLKDFILEYLNNAFIWDTQFFRTIWNLVCRPGRLTQEYMSGKFVSQEHPLKLNMFLLFVFISMFLLFSGSKGDDDSVITNTQTEFYYPALQIEFLKKDPDFVAKLDASPRDTVRLYAPLHIVEEYSDVVSKVDVIEDTQGQSFDRWVAAVPRVLIEDDIIILGKDDYYVFNADDDVVADELSESKVVWLQLVDIVTTYFPVIMLFTMPLLAMAVAFIQRKKKLPFIHHFIFSLHYTALLELLIIAIYTLYLVASPSMSLLMWILRLGAGIYLTIAFHRVYESNSWVKAVLKALFTYLIYMLNCLFVLCVVFLIACFMAVAV